jgi:hypothetical protein
MKLLNIETPVTRNVIPQILLNVQDFYFHKVGYTSYEEGNFGPYTVSTYKSTWCYNPDDQHQRLTIYSLLIVYSHR